MLNFHPSVTSGLEVQYFFWRLSVHWKVHQYAGWMGGVVEKVARNLKVIALFRFQWLTNSKLGSEEGSHLKCWHCMNVFQVQVHVAQIWCRCKSYAKASGKCIADDHLQAASPFITTQNLPSRPPLVLPSLHLPPPFLPPYLTCQFSPSLLPTFFIVLNWQS